MANVTFKNESTTTAGELPAVGDQLPDFTLVGTDLGELTPADFAGKRVVLNIFPSLDTGVCAKSVREFNERATSLDNTVVLGVSQDLPFAHGRFCSAEGIENVTTGSAFRSSFGEDYGLTLQGSPLQGLLARAVIVADENGKVVYTQLVDEITDEPDYDAAVNALS
ncbi:lipid hydroperoxide peroxidase [Corynebacterium humireducens NBRC 106098 = DSM 45392]|uniref:Thiol peroxidase n=1 Tax=Corynebacterium humireducens NBRC 106098 = DSM 45392 TaxID=1223515 RepID=A0A0B5DC26_9CORY|nr:thiol peroxidase [Corynebacterium humireducens]AJE33319.1 lipid hydroperoxide peroxidase [Corynebacterium humireducens NBRC 106098 = DSM 45392]